MSNINNALCKPAAGVLAALTLACLGLTACGGSSGSSTNAAGTGAAATSTTATSTTSASTSTSGPSTQGSGPRVGTPRFPATRECLQKNGITLPTRTPGSSGPAGRGLQLPNGVTRARFEAALKKCDGNFARGFGRPNGPGVGRVTSPVFRQALVKYAECLRQNGVNIPAPNTSGNGPIFSTKSPNASSPQFRAATMKCRSTLIGAFRRSPRTNGAAGAGASPPAGGQAQGSESSG